MTTASGSTSRERHLGHIRVHDVMHRGIISVDPQTPIGDVARVMASQRVHAVAVRPDPEAGVPWMFVSALDAVTAATADVPARAGQIAGTEVLAVSADERLDHAAQLMAEHALSHLIVTDPASGQPTGVLSTLDILAVVAG